MRISGAVHNIDLEPGGSWFSPVAVDTGACLTGSRRQCTIGEGAAATLGEDAGKKRMAVGDTFEFRRPLVASRRHHEHARGTTYGSEVWTSVEEPDRPQRAARDKFTTMVLRMADDSEASAKAMAALNDRYTEAKLKAFAEPDYYKELPRPTSSS